MYRFIADFKRHDSKKQPYSFLCEKNSNVKHGNGYVENGTYSIVATHGKNFALTPDLQSFTLKTQMCIMSPLLFYMPWGYYIGYDLQTRRGKFLACEYYENSRICITLFDVDSEESTELSKISLEGATLDTDVDFPLTLEVSQNKCKININGNVAEFDGDFSKGKIGISKFERGGAGIRLKSFEIYSEDEINAETLYKGSFTLPRYEGNPFPYEIDLEILKYENGVKEIVTKMHGGVEFAPKNNPSIKTWASHRDQFESPYIRFVGDCEAKKLYLRSGRLTFVDDVNVNSPVISQVALADPTPRRENPFTKSFTLKHFEDFKYFVVGYDLFKHFRCDLEAARDTECVYDKNGNMIYYGDKLEKECIIKVASEKSAIEKLIRNSEFVKMDDAIEHIRNNHYFTTDEIPSFTVTVLHDKNADNVLTKAYLANTYFKKIRSLELELVSTRVNELSKTESVYKVKSDVLPQNVYHLVIESYYGNKLIEKHESAFEVFDKNSDKSPVESANLPFFYIGDGSFPQPTHWSVKPDCNIIHYVDTSVAGPLQIEAVKAWELNKIYRRKQLVWFTQRTVGLDTYKEHMDCVKNADYIYYLYPGIEESGNYYRYDHFHKNLFEARIMREFYNEFCDLHPEYNLDKLVVDSGNKRDFGHARFKAMEPFFDEWVDFVNPKIDKLFDEQWEEVLKVNPKAKRYSYGPFNAYATHAVGAEVIKYFGHPESVIEKRFSFVQYEDYPFCCNYPLAHGTWGLMTSKLRAKTLEVGPEIYDSFEAGCPDTHVSLPTPPFSESYAPPYQTTSQIYAYLYNSYYHSKDGYKYWRDNKFMMYGIYNVEGEARFRETVLSWGKYLENKPLRPKKTVCYYHKFSDKDNEFELECAGSHRSVMQNKCGVAMNYIYTRLSEMGIPAGFVTDDLQTLNANDVDMLVIPSSYAMTGDDIATVRELYKKGVRLIATGDVTGLEDIFGVKPSKKTVSVSRLYKGTKSEDIIPFDAEFGYIANGAEAVLTEGEKSHPVLLKTDKTLLINASLGIVGAENLAIMACAGGRDNVSDLVREAMSEALETLTSPVVRAYGNAYANIFESENGFDEIMLYQCSDYEENSQLIKVCLNCNAYSDVSIIDDDRVVHKTYMNGKLSEFELTLRPRETVLLKFTK
jgi:hypothetical protein